MTLTENEKNSPLWQKLTKYLNESIFKAQRELEKTSLSVEETTVIRGRIKHMRHLLELKVEMTQPVSTHVEQTVYR